jgi:hypothetical protein
MLPGATEAAGSASGIFNNLGGFNPSQIQAGQINGMDLSGYMNPYTQNVIDTTMTELGNQERIGQQGVDDSALAQNAFGGDRMYVQKGVMNDKFNQLRKNTIADLYSKNFLNAQTMGQFDIGAKMEADRANQQAGIQGAGIRSGAGTGMSNIAQLLASAGIDLSKGGQNALGNLANMGFGWGNSLQQNQLAMGGLQQQQNQAILNAINGQVGGATGAPSNLLQQYLGSVLNPSGYGTTTQTTGGSGPAIAGIGTLLQGGSAFLPGSYTG